MKWLYKIWGGYDGFRPSAISQRLLPGGELELGWARYASAAEPGDEVWVWFFEGSRFDPGVYAKGIVESIDPLQQSVVLQTQEWSDTAPLTTPDENEVLAAVVAPKNRQVFVLPDEFRRFETCTATLPGADSCAQHRCDYCTYWERLPLILKSHVRTPYLLTGSVVAFAPAYWVVASRSFVYKQSNRTAPGVNRTTSMFYRFKTGEGALAYPLAKGMAQALAKRERLNADAIVPIPLSPEKVASGEINRTLLLAQALKRLINVPVVDALALTAPMGKRVAINSGQSMDAFRREYESKLAIDNSSLLGASTLILVDDVCTNGHTMSAAIRALRAKGVTADVVASTAGQMTIREAVLSERAVFKP